MSRDNRVAFWRLSSNWWEKKAKTSLHSCNKKSIKFGISPAKKPQASPKQWYNIRCGMWKATNNKLYNFNDSVEINSILNYLSGYFRQTRIHEKCVCINTLANQRNLFKNQNSQTVCSEQSWLAQYSIFTWQNWSTLNVVHFSMIKGVGTRR